MHTPRIVPWKDAAELVALRESFYPITAHTPTTLHRALATVAAYSVRGRLPPAIDATAGLVAAFLVDTDANRNAAGAVKVQLTYSMALVRFVNGLLDPAQQSQHAVSLSILARNMYLPQVFVDVRHAATHHSLPPRASLRSLTLRALDWLWHNYWSLLGTESDYMHTVRELLQSWKNGKRVVIKDDPGKRDYLITALLDEENMLASTEQFSKVAKLWMPLLEKIDSPGFVASLCNSMVQHIDCQVPSSSITNWIQYIVGLPDHYNFTKEEKFHVLKTCLLRCSQGDIALLKHLESRGSLPPSISHIVNTLKQPFSSSHGALNKRRDLEEIAKEIHHFKTRHSQRILEKQPDSKHRWRRPVGVWTAKPLGICHS